MSHERSDITYEEEADAAYISLVEIGANDVHRTVALSDRMIQLDFNQADELIGVEVLNSTKNLPENVIARAEEVGDTD